MPRVAIRDFGTALSFNGTSAYVEGSAIAALVGGGQRTFSAWINSDAPTATQSIFTTGSNANGAAILFQYDGVNKRVGLSTFGTDAHSGNNSLLPNTGYHHVVATINATTITLYIDGVQRGTPLTLNHTLNTTSFIWRIGRRHNSTEYFTGDIDDVRVWNTALSAAEVAALYYSNENPSTPVGWWKFNEGAGTSATDSSSNGNTGTITAATYTADVPMKPRMLARDYGTSLSFNGTTSKVVGSTLITQVDNVSFGGWARTRSLTAQRQAIFYTGDANNNGHGIFINKDTTVYGIYILIGSVAWKPTNILLKDTEWHHIFATRDTTNYYVYLDGVLVSVIPQSSAGTPTSGTRAGHDVVGYFLGDLDEIRHYSRQLSTSEVALLAQGGEPSTAGLNLLWKFDEGAGTSATDSSGSGNTGTITAGTYSSNVPTRAR